MLYAVRYSETNRFVGHNGTTSACPSEAKLYKTAHRAEQEAQFVSTEYHGKAPVDVVRFDLVERDHYVVVAKD